MVAKAIAAMKAKKMSPAERLGEERRAHVVAAVAGNVVAPDNCRRAEAEKRRHDVKAADQDHRPDDTDPRRLRIGHGVKANENVRQSGGAEDERHAQRNQIERAVIGRGVAQTGLEKILRHQLAFVVIGHVGHGVEEIRRDSSRNGPARAG